MIFLDVQIYILFPRLHFIISVLLDLIVVLDGSWSIKRRNFDLIKVWLANFVTLIKNVQGLGLNAVRFGLVS